MREKLTTWTNFLLMTCIFQRQTAQRWQHMIVSLNMMN